MSARRRRTLSAIALVFLLLPACASAAEFGYTETWEYEAAAYGWFSGVDGTATVAGRTIPIELGSPEFWRVLNLSFSFGLETHRGPWALAVDAAIVNTEDDVTFASGDPGTFRAEIVLPGVAGSYRLLAGSSARLEGLVGLRYTDIQLEARADTIEATADQSWLDPLAGLRLRGRLSDRLSYMVRGDVGGFGLGSEMSWNGIGALAFQTSARIQLALGYRYYDTRYDKGEGTDRFAYDASQQGLLAGIVVLF